MDSITPLGSAVDLESTYIGRLELRFEFLAPIRSFGLGGLQLPLRVVAGSITGPFVDATVLSGSDWASVAGSGLVRHRGTLLLSLGDERLIVDVQGLGQAPEEIVDQFYDGGVPGPIRCSLWLHVLTESRHFLRLERRLIVAVGSFDCGHNAISCDVFGIGY